ncbi:MAG: ribulokinase [Epulopiscium sp.]|nr:ribulokinase [Candidatus Epulonipiscium sp.]
MEKFVIGIDYGSDSCRAVLASTKDGHELTSEVFNYPRWRKGLYCDPSQSQYRQHPLDYIEGLEYTIKTILSRVDQETMDNIVAISVDTTGSTLCAINEEGVPLALLPEFAQNPNAMFILWKDHTAVKEADEINWTARNWGGEDYTKYIGGVYSSEWFFAKILRTIRVDKKVREAAYSWVEHCDWIPALLTGTKGAKNIMRSRCAAGHKAMWNEEFGGLPPNEFFLSIDPLLDGLRDRLFEKTYTSDQSAGEISEEWAQKLGLPKSVRIGIGAFDCHMGAVGGNIVPKAIVKVMGTSTCDIMIEDKEIMKDVLVEGICGQVDGSVVPGMLGMEAGQSAFGDVYAWFRQLISWPLGLIPKEKMSNEEIYKMKKNILFELEKEAKKVNPVKSTVLALDWINGRRTPYANQNLKGAITGITLGTSAPQVYRALIEATAFGSKAIVERFRESGVEINEAIAIGGVAKKSPLNMQIVANVLNMPVKVSQSEQTVALGASIFAAVVGGVYKNVQSAQQKMASPVEQIYYPEKDMVDIYEELYQKYLELGRYIEEKTKQGK